ncbi:MAG: YdcF family protein [Bacteroidota bacterium]
MFFIISKLGAFLLSPLTWVVLLLLCGLVIRNSKRARHYYLAGFIAFMFFTNAPIIDELVRAWEEPMMIPAANEHYQAGVVLGGGMVTIDTDYDRLIFRENTDRFLQAFSLYKNHIIKKIIISGGSGSLVFKETIEATLIKRYLTDVGVPLSDIIIDSTSNNTYENAVNCTKIIGSRYQTGRFLLLTSALHMRRAAACFGSQGQCMVMYPVGKMVGKRRTDIGYYLLPDTEALIRWEKYLHEVLGYLSYTFMGYI